jgi:tetrahydromethanopterin S-methyltransferase subunit B
MIDTTATLLALRARVFAVSVATTGSVSLSATTTTYARASGSFVTDGFAVGMEVLVSGFATSGNNGRAVITGLTAAAMTVTKIALSTVSATDLTPTIVAGTALAADVAAAGRTIVAQLPILRGYENVKIVPSSLAPYVEEDLVPATNTLVSFPARDGTVEETGLYVLKLYGQPNTGASGIRKTMDAAKLLFAPGTTVTAGVNVVRVRTDTAVTAGQLTPLDTGRVVCVLTVPWIARSTNAVAA